MTDQPINTAPFGAFGEAATAFTEPLPVPGYPQTDTVPGSAIQVPVDAASMMAELARQNQELIAQVMAQAEINQKLLTDLKAAKPVESGVSGPQGGPPVPHHLHLADGRVISGHDGIGTHYSETLPDGRSISTRIVAYYPAEIVDPVAFYG